MNPNQQRVRKLYADYFTDMFIKQESYKMQHCYYYIHHFIIPYPSLVNIEGFLENFSLFPEKYFALKSNPQLKFNFAFIEPEFQSSRTSLNYVFQMKFNAIYEENEWDIMLTIRCNSGLLFLKDIDVNYIEENDESDFSIEKGMNGLISHVRDLLNKGVKDIKVQLQQIFTLFESCEYINLFRDEKSDDFEELF